MEIDGGKADCDDVDASNFDSEPDCGCDCVCHSATPLFDSDADASNALV